MALSLHAKLIFLFLLPLVLFEIAQAKWKILKSEKKPGPFFLPLILWLFSFLIVYLSIIAIFFHSDFSLIAQQLIYPHFRNLNLPESGFSVIGRLILTDYDIALLGLMGIILLIRQKKWQQFFPVLWLGAALTSLAVYRPIWDHYYLLISIPICWLAAIAFSQFFIDIRNKPRTAKPNRRDSFFRLLTAIIITITIIRLPAKFNSMYRSITLGTNPHEKQAVDLLLKYKPRTHWIFTDRPIFAFYAGMLVPPEFAVISDKRNFTNKADQDYCIDKLEKYKPEIILLNELKYFSPRIISYIQKNYFKIYQASFYQRTLSRDLYDLSFGWRPEPLGRYLPKRMQIITDKWFYELVWHRVQIPIPQVMKNKYLLSFSEDNTTLRIFIRRDCVENKKSGK